MTGYDIEGTGVEKGKIHTVWVDRRFYVEQRRVG